MPVIDVERLQSWAAEFTMLKALPTDTVRVVPQDGADGRDTGLITIHLGHASTSTFVERSLDAERRWMASFERREEVVTLNSDDSQKLAEEIALVAEMCRFLDAKTTVSE